MSNLSDKDLDRLSREAADSYEPDTSSMSWSRLEQKLARQMPERPPDGSRFGRINPYVWGPAIVLLAGVSYFFIKNIDYSKDSTPKNEHVNQAISSTAGDNNKTDGNTIHFDSVSSADALTNGANNTADLKKQDGPVERPDAETFKPSETNRTPSTLQHANLVSGRTANASPRSVNNSAAASNGRSGGSKSKIIATGSIVGAGSVSSGTGRSGTTTSTFTDGDNKSGIAGSESTNETGKGNLNLQRKRNQISLPAIAVAGMGPGTINGNDSLLNRFAQSNKPIQSKSMHLNRSLNFGLSFGPDYTDGGGITNNQIGNNIGITIGYYLTGKLSINTGIFYSNKFYWAHGKGYNRPQPAASYATTYAASPPIDYVNGSCNMWEIPLTLRYDFAHNEKTKFFANAGLSSYFMMKQNYIYFVHTNQQQLGAWRSSNNQQVNYWFGVGDISLGFETEVGKGVSFQAEPFIRLPLRSMGVENLKLNSYGFLLSFRYTPVLNRSKK